MSGTAWRSRPSQGSVAQGPRSCGTRCHCRASAVLKLRQCRRIARVPARVTSSVLRALSFLMIAKPVLRSTNVSTSEILLMCHQVEIYRTQNEIPFGIVVISAVLNPGRKSEANAAFPKVRVYDLNTLSFLAAVGLLHKLSVSQLRSTSPQPNPAHPHPRPST